ncbi:MAG: hypothetical protein R2765_10120 [Ferruginibacter sp.]
MGQLLPITCTCGFDMKDFEIINNGKKSRISNNPFLHVGICVHVDKIKDFFERKEYFFL